VIVTKELPGNRWRRLLEAADFRLEIGHGTRPLSESALIGAIGSRCDAAICQLTEPWSEPVLRALRSAGGQVVSAYAVGYDNIDVPEATRLGLAVGNTPGVLTEATAEMAVALSFAAARRVVEGDGLTRRGAFSGWLPTLCLGELLWGKTLGIIGAGRIGSAYARMMAYGHRMNILYYSNRRNVLLEEDVSAYGEFLIARGEGPVGCRRTEALGELLCEADVVSLHVPLTTGTRHLIGAPELAAMKETAVLVNTSRGPVVEEVALVDHCRAHPGFCAGLDVYENEPRITPGLEELDNVVLAPHLGSATRWTREGMATLAAANVVAVLQGMPAWGRAATREDILPFLEDPPPRAAPSIVNAGELGFVRMGAAP
jgi:hydroxypyruvate reductase 1